MPAEALASTSVVRPRSEALQGQRAAERWICTQRLPLERCSQVCASEACGGAEPVLRKCHLWRAFRSATLAGGGHAAIGTVAWANSSGAGQALPRGACSEVNSEAVHADAAPVQEPAVRA